MLFMSTLDDDHRLILRVLDALEAYAEHLASGGQDPGRASLQQFSDFFLEFVGLNHHDAEESVLMPVLARNGFRWDTGVLERLRDDHRHEDHLLRALQQSSLQESPWSAFAKQSLVGLLRHIVAFGRQHVAYETRNVILAAMLRLPRPELEKLDAELCRYREQVVGEACLQRLRKMAEALIAAYPARSTLGKRSDEDEAIASARGASAPLI